MKDDKDDNKEFIKALKDRISQKHIRDECKKIREQNRKQGIDGGNKNSSFGMTVDFMKCLVSFEKPSTNGIAFLLYGDTWDEEKGQESGYLRLMDQRCGRKSFVRREQQFWYDVGIKAFGANVIGHLSAAEFVRTPISEILKRARDMDLSIPWEQLDPVLVLQLLALMQGDERSPAALRISKVENSRLIPIRLIIDL